ncbi:MAG: glutathione S-transferase N-terminal domain-containing protein [Kiloniellales bacterium]|nr:glutathione S-transferase N-terminal domain-containing protein [Kiloniellales bacterium]
MKLNYSPTSPYVRKVLVSALELGLADRIERVDSNPWDESDALPRTNPLGKVPALTTDDGQVLFDSLVICDYLDGLLPAPRLIPREAAARTAVLRLHAAADGVLDAAVLRLIENARRPEAYRWAEWDARQKAKIDRALDLLESEAEAFEGPLTLAPITLGCALGYLDFRFPGEDWRAGHPKLAAWYAAFGARPAMRDTAPPKT